MVRYKIKIKKTGSSSAITDVYEMVMADSELFDRPAAAALQRNPRRKVSKAAEALADAAMAAAVPELADYSAFAGLRVRVALLRDPGWEEIRKSLPVVMCSGDAHRLLKHMSLDPQESFVELLLNAKHQVIGSYEAFRGSQTSVEVHPADLYRPALVAGAQAIIVAHNHPSGDPEPSMDDIKLTSRLQDAGRLLAVSCLDHLVVGAGRYVSMADRGYF